MVDEQGIWRRIAAGDAEAFDALYRESGPRLRAFLRQLLPGEQEAEDVMQETFTQIWRRPQGFDPDRGSLRGYVFGIGRKLAAEWWRGQRPTDEIKDESGRCATEMSSMVADAFRRPARNGKMIGYRIDLVGRDGDGVKLAVRTKTFGPVSGSFQLSDIQNERQKMVHFEPGQTLKIDVAGTGTLTVTGEWFDHMPVFIGRSKQDFQAGPEELRVVSPLLLSDKQVAGDLRGGTAIAEKAGEGVDIYMQDEGRFILSLSEMRGAVQARVMANRISFEDGGHSYLFVTGSPVTRDGRIWVLHEADFKPGDGRQGSIGTANAAELKRLAPGVVGGEGAK